MSKWYEYFEAAAMAAASIELSDGTAAVVERIENPAGVVMYTPRRVSTSYLPPKTRNLAVIRSHPMPFHELLKQAWEAGQANAPFSTENYAELLAEAIKTAWIAGSHNMPYDPAAAAQALVDEK